MCRCELPVWIWFSADVSRTCWERLLAVYFSLAGRLNMLHYVPMPLIWNSLPSVFIQLNLSPAGLLREIARQDCVRFHVPALSPASIWSTWTQRGADHLSRPVVWSLCICWIAREKKVAEVFLFKVWLSETVDVFHRLHMILGRNVICTLTQRKVS